MPVQINPTLLAEYVGSDFEVLDDPAQGFSLALTGIADYIKTDRSEAFSLLFHGPAAPFLPQATHKLHHPALGDLDIFLVPVAQDKTGYQYEAVFNYMV